MFEEIKNLAYNEAPDHREFTRSESASESEFDGAQENLWRNFVALWLDAE